MGTRNVEKNGIKQFCGKDFDHWQFRVRLLLQENEVYECVVSYEPLKSEELMEWKKKDFKCQSLIVQCIADSHIEYVKNKTSAKDMWETLEATFKRKGVISQMYLRRKLLSFKFQTGTLEEHFVQFDEIINQLKSAGAKLEESDIVCHLLLTLPSTYDNICTALETLLPEMLNINFVKSRLLDEELKRKNTETMDEVTDNRDAAFNSGPSRFNRWGRGRGNYGGKRIVCFRCNLPGHRASQCRSAQECEERDQPGESSEPQHGGVCFMASHSPRFISMIVDSGATDHLVSSDTYFSSLVYLKNKVNFAVAKAGQSLEAHMMGTIEIELIVDGKGIIGSLNNVLLVNNISRNLLSVQRLEQAGFTVTFKDGKVKIEKNNILYATGYRKNKLYEINFKIKTDCSPLAGFTRECNEDLVKLWHERFGHIGFSVLKNLVSKNMVDGVDSLPNLNSYVPNVCEACVMGKQTRLPFFTRTDQPKRPLEIVHTDICGPVTPQTWNNKKYFLTFIDGYTHFTVVYLLTNKSEVFHYFKQFVRFAESYFSLKISRLRSDNGREYLSKEFKEFCEKKGIVQDLTVPYTPEQNGLAEKMNRTLVEKARAMISGSGLPKYMWGEAILTAAHLINRSPTVQLRVTPAEMWYGTKPSVKRFKVFGCVAYALRPKQLRKGKFEGKSDKCLMLGYSTNGYRLWNINEEKVILSRDVVFNEREFLNLEEYYNKEKRMISNEIECDVSGLSECEKLETSKDNEEEKRLNENKNEEKMEVPFLRRSTRIRKPPVRYGYTDEINIVLGAEEFVGNEPKTYNEVLDRSDCLMWKQAIDDEIKSLEKNETWELVDADECEGKSLIDSRWVFKIKRDSQGNIQKYKARLVARGFMQQQGLDFFQVYSPVAKLSTVRLILAYANQYKFLIHQMDVKTAFLNGYLNEIVYMAPPEGINLPKNKVCKLKRSLYGLKQAPRCWNERLNKFLLSLGYSTSSSDCCLYVKKGSSLEIESILLVFVDDILLMAKSLDEIDSIKQKLSTEFEMTDLNEVSTFLGLNVLRNFEKGILEINQTSFIDKILSKFGMSECKGSNVPVQPGLKLVRSSESYCAKYPYRELIGCLMYLMLGTRPDICYAINYFSRFQDSFSEEHWNYAKHVLQYLKNTRHHGLRYSRYEDSRSEPLVGYADADWAGDPADRKSVTGYVFKAFGCPVSWCTKKQATVTLSSTEAEYLAASAATCEAVCLRRLLVDLGVDMSRPVIMFEDNQGCIRLTEQTNSKRTKHIDVRHHYIREKVEEGLISLKYIPSQQQVADILTKGLPPPVFIKLRAQLGVVPLASEPGLEEGC